MRQIIALGGGGFGSSLENLRLDEYLLSLCAASRPKVGFIPTASGDSIDYIAKFETAYQSLNAQTSVFQLFRSQTWTGTPEEMLLDQDLIFVGGGSTMNMMLLWQAWGIDAILRKAYDQGTILAGISAGANIWFEQCTTDSLGPGIQVMPCLGWLPGSFTPHYDSEPERKPLLRQMLREQTIAPGYAATDGAAVHFINEEFHRIVTDRESAKAFEVDREGETPLEFTPLYQD
jgi:dipeptidase E